MLKEVLEKNGLSVTDAAKMVGYDKSTLSKIISGTYPHAKQKEKEILLMLQHQGYETPDIASNGFQVDQATHVATSNVERFHKLADSLLDFKGSLNSSLGVVIGTAGRGKTYTSRRYSALFKDCVYVLYVDGFSLVKLLREIAFQLSGSRPGTFESCLYTIENASRINRKLVIIDEADKMPLRYHEMLRGINERCSLPIMLVGEEELYAKLANVPRLRSRIRKPVVKFTPVDVADVATFYRQAVNLPLAVDVCKALCERASGDFRTVVNEANELCDLMNTNGLNSLDRSLLEQI